MTDAEITMLERKLAQLTEEQFREVLRRLTEEGIIPAEESCALQCRPANNCVGVGLPDDPEIRRTRGVEDVAKRRRGSE